MRTARVGDSVSMNCPHGGTGTIVTGSENVIVNGKMVAREMDTVVCNKCGISRSINAGECSGDTFANGRQVARVGDPSTGTCDPGKKCCPHVSTATIAEGSDDTLTNN